MKENEFAKENFIGGWHIPNEVCDDLISFLNGIYKCSILRFVKRSSTSERLLVCLNFKCIFSV